MIIFKKTQEQDKDEDKPSLPRSSVIGGLNELKQVWDPKHSSHHGAQVRTSG